MTRLKADENLTPIRRQIVELIEPSSKVIEFRCGNGDLLLSLSPKIKHGLGIDKSEALIGQAINHKENRGICNVDFVCKELGKNYAPYETYDFSVASLFFHVIPQSESLRLVNKMIDISDNVLVCAFSCPESINQKLLLWLDQRFSSHHRNFNAYQRSGYFEGILKNVRYSNLSTFDTFIPFVKIYRFS